MSASRPVLLLDVMGTLCHDPFHVEMPDFFGTTLEELMAVKHPTAWIEFERGEIDGETFLARFFADGRDYDREGLVRRVRESYAWIEGMEELVAELSARGVEMHALSNYPRWYEMIEERLGLSRYVPWTFVSCRTGVRKPDPEAWLGAARALGRSPSACLFVDDRPSNCEAARAQGMPAVRFEDAATLRPALRERGLVP